MVEEKDEEISSWSFKYEELEKKQRDNQKKLRDELNQFRRQVT